MKLKLQSKTFTMNVTKEKKMYTYKDLQDKSLEEQIKIIEGESK